MNIPVDEADSRGRVRLICGNCGARVLIKMAPRALKLSPDIPFTSSSPNLTPVDREYSGMWAVVVYELQPQDQGSFRRALLAMPRFRSNPNKLHDATSSLPYTFVGLKKGEAEFLGEELDKLGSRHESGPQEWLLNDVLIPRSRSSRGPMPALSHEDSDIEVLSAAPGSSWEIQFDGGRPSRPDLPAQSSLQPAEPRRPRYSAQSMPTVDRLMEAQDEDQDDESIIEVEDDADVESPEPPSAEQMARPAAGVDDSDDANDQAGDEADDAVPDDSDDDFAIVSINKLPGRKFHIGTLHTTISVPANELEVGSQTSIDAALEQAHAVLQERAQDLGGTGIVGLRVTQSAIPTDAGWMLVFVVSGTAVA